MVAGCLGNILMKKSVLVIGSGSIAKKHIINLISLNFDVYILINGLHTKKNLQFIKSKKIFFITSLKDIADKIDFAIIATSSNKHLNFIKKLALKKINIFCEKLIFLSLKNVNKIRSVLKQNKIIFSTNYQLQSHDLYRYIKKNILKKNIVSVSLKVGQNLKNWRAIRPSQHSYYLDKKKGGGVIFELIHEVNLINNLFGKIVSINTLKKNSYNFSNIEDIAISVFRTDHNIYGTLYQDMISIKSFREIEIICKNKNYLFDLLSNKIKIYYQNKSKIINYKKNQAKQMHLLKKNILNFCLKIKNKNISLTDFDNSLDDLKVCLKMHG